MTSPVYSQDDIAVIEQFLSFNAFLVPMKVGTEGNKHPPKNFKYVDDNRHIESKAELHKWLKQGWLIAVLPESVQMLAVDFDMVLALTNEGLQKHKGDYQSYIADLKSQWKNLPEMKKNRMIHEYVKQVAVKGLVHHASCRSSSGKGQHLYYRYQKLSKGVDIPRNVSSPTIEVICGQNKLVTIKEWKKLAGFFDAPENQLIDLHQTWHEISNSLNQITETGEEYSDNKWNYAASGRNCTLFSKVVWAAERGDEEDINSAIAEAQSAGLGAKEINATVKSARKKASKNPPRKSRSKASTQKNKTKVAKVTQITKVADGAEESNTDSDMEQTGSRYIMLANAINKKYPHLTRIYSASESKKPDYYADWQNGKWTLISQGKISDLIVKLAIRENLITGDVNPTTLKYGALEIAHTRMDYTQIDDWDVSLVSLPIRGGQSIDLNNPLVLIPTPKRDLMTVQIPVSPDEIPTSKEKDTGRFREFVADWLNPEQAEFLQMALGQALIGNPAALIILAIGVGRNGKSTLFQYLQATLNGSKKDSDHKLVCTVETDYFLQSLNTGKHTEGLVKLRTARISLCGEVPDSRSSLNAGLVKPLTGGDTIVARKLYQNNIEFRALAMPIIHGNHDLRIENPDDGIRRRIKYLHFANQFDDADDQTIDSHSMKEIINNDKGACLRWILEGLQKFIENGYKMPKFPTVEADTNAYLEEQDEMRTEFLRYFEPVDDPKAFLEFENVIFKTITANSKRKKFKNITAIAMSRLLKNAQLGYDPKKRPRGIHGYRLKDDFNQLSFNHEEPDPNQNVIDFNRSYSN